MAPATTTTTETDMDRLFRMTLASERKAIDYSMSKDSDNMSQDSTRRLRTTVIDQWLSTTPFDVPILTTGPKRNSRSAAVHHHKTSNPFKLSKRYGIYSIPEDKSVCQGECVLLHNNTSNRSVASNNKNKNDWHPPRPAPPMSHREDKLMLPQQRKRANETTATSFLDGTLSSLTTSSHPPTNATSRRSKRQANHAMDSGNFESILERLAAAAAAESDNDQNTPEQTTRKSVSTPSAKPHKDKPASVASTATRSAASKKRGDQTSSRNSKRDRNRAVDADAFTGILECMHVCIHPC